MEIKKYIEARKVIDVKREFDIEITKTHVVRIEDEKYWEMIKELSEEKYEDDYEGAFFSYGISCDFEGEIYSVNVCKLIQLVKDKINSNKEDLNYTEEDGLIINLRKLIKFLEDYEDYDFYFKEEKK